MADKIFMFHQSNCSGAPNADCHPTLIGPLAGCEMFNGSVFAPLQNGVNQEYPTTTDLHGPLNALMYNLRAYRGYDIYASMYRIGATKLNDDGTTNCWFPPKRGALVDKAKSTFNKAMSVLWNVENIRTIDNFFFIPIGGNSDCNLDADANSFYANYINWIAQMEKIVSGSVYSGSKKRWIIPKLSLNNTADPTRRTTVNQAIDDICALDSDNRQSFDTTPYGLQPIPEENHHTAQGQKQIGEYMVNNIIIPRGW